MSLIDLLQSLDSQQLEDVARWLRETASEYDSVGQQSEADCLRSQASRLETLVSELITPGAITPGAITPGAITSSHTASGLEEIGQQCSEDSATASRPAVVIRQKHRRTDPSQVIKGWLQSREDASQLAYLLMGDGTTVRQTLKDDGNEASEPCASQEMERAYRSGRFTILAGADHLADYFSVEPENALGDGILHKTRPTK